jgi:hypothetical protein
MWQRTDKDGLVHTEVGIEVKPGDIRKWPSDLWQKAQPVGNKLQYLLLQERHPELAKEVQQQEPVRAQAVTPGPGRPEPTVNLPADFEITDGGTL